MGSIPTASTIYFSVVLTVAQQSPKLLVAVRIRAGKPMWCGGREAQCNSLQNCKTVGSNPTHTSNAPVAQNTRKTRLFKRQLGCGFESRLGYQRLLSVANSKNLMEIAQAMVQYLLFRTCPTPRAPRHVHLIMEVWLSPV